MENRLTPQQRLDRAIPHIERSLERSNPDETTLADILHSLNAGDAHLWENEHAAAVTAFFQTAKVSLDELVWAAGGEMAALMEILERGAEWLSQNGFDRLMIEDTRKGWAKALKPYGFTLKTVLVKEL